LPSRTHTGPPYATAWAGLGTDRSPIPAISTGRQRNGARRRHPFPRPPNRDPTHRQPAAGAPRPVRRPTRRRQSGAAWLDQIDVTGTVNLTGSKLDLTLLGAFHGHKGETFEIISNDGIDPVNGHFAGLVEGAYLVAGGKVFSISYHGGDGNDVVLTEHGNAVVHAVHQAHAVIGNDLLFA
jgi:hypothetical protein